MAEERKNNLSKFHDRDIILTETYLSRSPLYSGYWVRRRLDSAIARYAKRAHGTLLDVGCGIKPYESLFLPYVSSYLGLEYSPQSGYRGNRADFCADAANLPFCENTFDTILCTEVMEHLPNPERTIEEFARTLKPGGTLITTAPFFYPIHDSYDFFRYGPKGLAAIMERYGLEVERVEPLSGSAVTLAILVNLYWCDLGFMWNKWLYPIGVILRPFLWLGCLVINLLGGVFEKLIPSNHMSFNHLTIANKSSS